MRFRPGSIRPSVLSAALTAVSLMLLVAATERHDADLEFWSWPTVALVTVAMTMLLERTLFSWLEGDSTSQQNPVNRLGALDWTAALVPPLILGLAAAVTVSAEAPRADWLIPAGAIWLGSITSAALSRPAVRRE